MFPPLARRSPLLCHDKRRVRRARWQASRIGVLHSRAVARWPPSPLHRHRHHPHSYPHPHLHPLPGKVMHSSSYSGSRVDRGRNFFGASLLLAVGRAPACPQCKHFLVFCWGTLLLRKQAWGNVGHRVGCVCCFHDNIQLHYMKVLLVLLKERKHHAGSDSFFPILLD